MHGTTSTWVVIMHHHEYFSGTIVEADEPLLCFGTIRCMHIFVKCAVILLVKEKPILVGVVAVIGIDFYIIDFLYPNRCFQHIIVIESLLWIFNFRGIDVQLNSTLQYKTM